MKRALAFCALLILTASAVHPAKAAGEGAAAMPGGPESLLLVREAWIVFVDEPSGYLQEAYAAFLRNDPESAQENLRKAGAFLFMQARWADGDTKKELEDSLKELNGLINGLDGESSLRAAEFRKAFARAEYRLALGHLLFAADLVEQKSYGTAGYALDAAAAHLLFADLWLDEDLDPEDALSARTARSLAADLRAGAEGAVAKVRGALKDVGRGLHGLSKTLKLAPGPLPEELHD